jgi:hypothetical protein
MASQSRWTTSNLSRLAAAIALAVLLGNFAYFSSISPPLGPPEPSAPQIVHWTTTHQQVLLFQFVPAYVALAFALLIGVLVYLSRGQGILVNLAWLAVAGNFALTLTGFGAYVSLWTYLQRGASADGMVALYSLASLPTHAQLIPLGLAIASVGLLGLRSRAWPVALSWLAIIVGAEHVLSCIAFASGPSFSTTTTAWTLGGIARAADILLDYIWLLATMFVLALRPVRQEPAKIAANA